MILYHGSKGKYDNLEKRQAQKADGIEVPKEELQEAIYLSTDYAFALAMCSMPDGLTYVNDDMTIKTEFPEQFDPNMRVYIYSINSESIPAEKLEFLEDGLQVVCHLDKLPYESLTETTAGEVLKYYKLLDYEGGEGAGKEIKQEYKIK